MVGVGFHPKVVEMFERLVRCGLMTSNEVPVASNDWHASSLQPLERGVTMDGRETWRRVGRHGFSISARVFHDDLHGLLREAGLSENHLSFQRMTMPHSP